MSKLNFKTRLYLKLIGVEVLDHNINKIKFKRPNPYEVYVFENFSEYTNFFGKYIKNLDKNKIKSAILSTTKNGQIIAFKAICDDLIIYFKTKEFYDKFDKEKIDEIHSRGKLTPFDKVEEYKLNDICAPGDGIGTAKDRCDFFDTCEECLREFVSHKDEYDKIDFKIVNKNSNEKTLKKTLG